MAADCGGGIRRREKGETVTARREFDSSGPEHLRGHRSPFLASDWAELRRARPATRGATELGRRRRRAHSERRQGLGRRQLATGGLLMLLPESKGRRWSEEGERRGCTTTAGEGAVTMADGAKRDRFGLGPRKRKETSARSVDPLFITGIIRVNSTILSRPELTQRAFLTCVYYSLSQEARYTKS